MLLCKLQPESNIHLLFECPASSTLWSSMLSWLGVNGVMHNDPGINFLQFGELLGKDKPLTKAASAIWVGTVCSIWQARNSLIFQQKEPDFQKLAEELKLKIKSWLEIYLLKVKECSYVEWLGEARKFL